MSKAVNNPQYCLRCGSALSIVKVMTDIESGFMSNAYKSINFGICMDGNCPNQGLLTYLYSTKPFDNPYSTEATPTPSKEQQ